MSSEIHLAFAHPKERSEANETEPVYDRISLRDHIVEVEIGAFQSERGSKQRVC
jgi:dihydroneopterin aldolase